MGWRNNGKRLKLKPKSIEERSGELKLLQRGWCSSGAGVYSASDEAGSANVGKSGKLVSPAAMGRSCSSWGEKELLKSKQWYPTPVLLPGKPYGWRSLVGYGPWGCTELEMTECAQHSNNHRDCYGPNTFSLFSWLSLPFSTVHGCCIVAGF